MASEAHRLCNMNTAGGKTLSNTILPTYIAQSMEHYSVHKGMCDKERCASTGEGKREWQQTSSMDKVKAIDAGVREGESMRAIN